MPYAADGTRVDALDVLDQEEYGDYLRSLRNKPRSVHVIAENTEEKAVAAYEAMVYGGGE